MSTPKYAAEASANKLLEQLEEILDAATVRISDIQPSVWCEENRLLTTEESPYPGLFSYDRTPYAREIVNCVSASHPAKRIAVMKGAQIGFSTGVIEPAIGYIISEQPGPILYLTGHDDLSKESMDKMDRMLDNSGLRPLIRSTIQRKKNQKTGDTNQRKDFPGGWLLTGSATNHKLLRQRSVRYGFIDDFEAVKASSKESGDTTALIEKRFTAYRSKQKIFYISTPELHSASNIEPAFLRGDQRYYHIPCPCCGDMIVLHWETDRIGEEGKEKAGITWQLDDEMRIIPGTVGYICQSCGGFFDDSNKQDLLQAGRWIPTNTKLAEPDYYSYHISALYAPSGMSTWEDYAREWLEANPPNGRRDEKKHQTFVNTVLGLTYEPQGEEPKANDLQKNVRAYQPGVVPEKQSLNDGNGRIVFITCAADLNGIVEDARLDYEVVAWSESGASYSIDQGSIGTFIPREGSKRFKEDRLKWTYEHFAAHSVWPKFQELINKAWPTDTQKTRKITISGIDTGHYTNFAYQFIDSANGIIVGVRGDKENQYRKFGIDTPIFKPARERSKLYLVDVNLVKDKLAAHMKLKWNKGQDAEQPYGFMNFPESAPGKYQYHSFYSHYESEKWVPDEKDAAARWVKKSTNAQNHFWDVRVYNMSLRDIFVNIYITKYNQAVKDKNRIQKPTWQEFCQLAMPR